MRVLLIILFFLPVRLVSQVSDFTATDIHGETHNLYNYLDLGKHVVLDFFFTTCGPCIQNIPLVNNAYTNFGCNTKDVIFISINAFNTESDVIAYENTYGSIIPAISGIEGGGEIIKNAYSVSAYPTLILIAPNKTIISQPSQYGIGFWPPSLLESVLFAANLSYETCGVSTAIEDNSLSNKKELLKVTDILGRETKGTKNEVLFYIYDDGTVEKRIVIE